MAIELKYSASTPENEFWFDFDNAYFKIEKNELRLDFKNEIIKIPVRGYASKEAREKEASGVFKRLFKMPFPSKEDNVNLMSTDDVLAYCYKKISELPFFKDGTAV